MKSDWLIKRAEAGVPAGAAAHELGHSKEMHGHPRQRLKELLYGAALPASLLGSGASYLALKKGLFGRPVGSRGAATLGGGIALAGYLPKLYEEHRASKHGAKGLKSVLTPEQARRAITDNKLALSTYLMGAAGSVGGAASWGIRNPKVSGRLGLASLALVVPQILAHRLLDRRDKKGALLSPAQVGALQRAMGTKAEVRAYRDVPASYLGKGKNVVQLPLITR